MGVEQQTISELEQKFLDHHSDKDEQWARDFINLINKGEPAQRAAKIATLLLKKRAPV